MTKLISDQIITDMIKVIKSHIFFSLHITYLKNYSERVLVLQWLLSYRQQTEKYILSDAKNKTQIFFITESKDNFFSFFVLD